MDAKEEKRLLRSELRKRRIRLDREYCRMADQSIFRQVTALPEYIESPVIFCYVNTEGEIDTRPLILDALRRGKQVGVPLCTGKGRMEVRRVWSLESLRPGSFGILEPEAEAPRIEPEQVGLALIPCLSCTEDGRRLGYGGGYYDRYLRRMAGCRAVLCRKRMMERELPEESHDARMDVVICEEGIYRVHGL